LLSALLWPPWRLLIRQFYGVINPNAGFLVGLKAFTAAVLGGIGSIPGAMLGGLVLGVAEAFGADISATNTKTWWPSACWIVVLLFRRPAFWAVRR
jgi:branched-chain amino acid transport system permease protein